MLGHSQSDKTIKKYLSTYVEPELKLLSTSKIPDFEAVLVLPIFDESIENLNRFLTLNPVKKIAMIWVFNSPDNAEVPTQSRTQIAMHHFITTLGAEELNHPTIQNSGVFYTEASECLALYIIDRCSEGCTIPAKQGVGLARKLGMDFGLKLIDQQADEGCEPAAWIHSSDADVVLPHGYFDIPAPEEQTSAIIYPFEHLPEQGYELPMALYDFSLRYYVDQLKFAGSPYAFHTIGSLIAVTPLAYAKVRGMPKRSGAEDFYLLNKLAKVGSVRSLDSPIINIAGRPSHRVPFGTGPALVKLQEMDEPLLNYTFYYPEIFQALKVLLMIVSEAEQSIASAEVLFKQLQDKIPHGQASHVIAALKALKIEKQFEHLSQKKTKTQFIKGFHTWFDAFVSLRFIHLMRDIAYPSVNLATLKQYFDSNGVEIEYYPRIRSLGI
jgi:hypothetical protein